MISSWGGGEWGRSDKAQEFEIEWNVDQRSRPQRKSCHQTVLTADSTIGRLSLPIMSARGRFRVQPSVSPTAGQVGRRYSGDEIESAIGFRRPSCDIHFIRSIA
jgi:hypothetical protein